MKRLASLLSTLLIIVLTCGAQKLTVESMEPAPFDLTASVNQVLDLNNNPCGLVKVQLAAQGAEFGGNIIKPVKHETSQYLVYMTEGSKMLNVQCPGFLPLMVYFRDYGIQRIEAKQTYVLTLVMPGNSNVPVDDGMRYLVVNVKPANAVVFVDEQMYTPQDGSASVLLSRGVHNYRVQATGYSPKSGTVEIADSKVTVDVELESALAQITVSCPTAGAQVYVNGNMKGTAPWSGQLSPGNYQIEARLDGYRPQRQGLALAQKESRTVELPALTPIVGVLNVNYKPVNAEVWMDGKKLGTSPDIFRNVLVGNHNIEVRANGYQTDKKTVTVNEGETTQLSGSLNPLSSSGSNAIASSSNAITSTSNAAASSSNAIMPVPDAVDLGLSVKWASFNLGASKPEEYGNYYKWGATAPNGKAKKGRYYWWETLKPKYDAAAVNLGGKWRMPTPDEIDELIKKCKREWTTVNGINGIRVTGPNGNSIFLPASGYREPTFFGVGSDGLFWSASAWNDNDGIFLIFNSSNWYRNNMNRGVGIPVRPVLAE